MGRISGVVGAAILVSIAVALPALAASQQDHEAHHPRTAAVSSTALPVLYSGERGVTLANRLVEIGVSYKVAQTIVGYVDYVREYVLAAIAADEKRFEGDELSQTDADMTAIAALHAEYQARRNVLAALGNELGMKVNDVLFGPSIRDGTMGRLGLLDASKEMTPKDIDEKPVIDLSGLDVSMPADSTKQMSMYDYMMIMMNQMQPHMKDMMGGSATEVPKKTDLSTDLGTPGVTETVDNTGDLLSAEKRGGSE